MEQSSKPPAFDSDPIGNSARSVNANGSDDHNLNEQAIADRLLAALSDGNLVHLEAARKAFVRQQPTKTEQELADLTMQLERRISPMDKAAASIDQGNKE